MSSRISFSLFVSTVAAATALLSGCIIVDGSTNNGTGGSGGTGAQGGGGAGAQGGGGTGGAIGVGGGGGAGGGMGCAGPNDGILDIKSCDAMNITPKPQGPADLCMAAGGATYNPPGYDYCGNLVFGNNAVFTSGAADVLQKCLAKIQSDPTNACDVVNVATCIGEASYAACPSQLAADTCNEIAKQCAMFNEPFNSTKCQTDLNPLLDTAVAKVVDVFNTNVKTFPCQASYDGALDPDGVDGAYRQVVLTLP